MRLGEYGLEEEKQDAWLGQTQIPDFFSLVTMAQAIDTLKRRLETILHDFKRARSTWHEISDHTLSNVNALVNALIQSRCALLFYALVLYTINTTSRYVDDAAYWHPALCMEYPNMTQAYNKKIQWVIDQHHNKVSSMVDKMACVLLLFNRSGILAYKTIGKAT